MSRRKGTQSKVTAAEAGTGAGTPDATARGAPPDEARAHDRASSLTVLLYELGKSNRQRAEELLRSLGYGLLVCEQAEEAQRALAGDTPPEIVLAGMPGGEAVVRAAALRAHDRPLALVIASSGDTDVALATCEQTGADSFLLRPYKRDALASTLRAAAVAREERLRRVAVERELAAERARLARHGETDPITGFYHFEFFKRVLVIELKRARRYGYSLAAALVALDEKSLEGTEGAARQRLLGLVARALSGVVRDIDLPVDYADGRFLVFLPYTDISGAERVGARLAAAVRAAEPVELEDGRRVRPSVSVGIAALKEGKAVSFSRLVRDASLALKAAQLKGGARVVAKP